MTKNRILASLLLFCLVFLVFSQEARAALRAKGSSVTLEEAVNPRPTSDDIILPMPCGASMAFKAVGVQSEGFLWDMQTLFGCYSCDRQGQDYYESRYSAPVSGPFSARDLPETWRKNLQEPAAGQYFYYFIGKYEVSNLQWRAVMDGICPKEGEPLNADDALPKTGISWFDAMEFSRKYTAWLLENSPESLPVFPQDSKNVGYLRLPTEIEWEYAARGGQKVQRSDLRERDFFVLNSGETYSDYAVYRSENRVEEQVANIGSRLPNPLGIYDTAGNVAEMVMDTFHFSLGGRLHGSSGGYVRKGGSFLSSESEIMPGRREEVAFFQSKGEVSSRDMGMRLALSGINTPAGDRPDILKKEWQSAGEGNNLLLDTGKNPIEELDRLIAQTENPAEKQNLERLRSIMKDNNIALERQNEAAMEALVRSSLFMVETVRNYGVRHKSLVNMIESSKAERESAKDMSKATREAVEKTIADLEANREGMERSLDAAVMFYRDKVAESLNYPEKLFDAKLALIASELTGKDLLTQNMLKAHALYAKHVQMLRSGKQSSLTRDFLINDILPVNLREGLSKGSR